MYKLISLGATAPKILYIDDSLLFQGSFDNLKSSIGHVYPDFVEEHCFSNERLFNDYIESKRSETEFDPYQGEDVNGCCVNQTKSLLALLRQTLHSPTVGGMALFYEEDIPRHLCVYIPYRDPKSHSEYGIALFERGGKDSQPLSITDDGSRGEYTEGHSHVTDSYYWANSKTIIKETIEQDLRASDSQSESLEPKYSHRTITLLDDDSPEKVKALLVEYIGSGDRLVFRSNHSDGNRKAFVYADRLKQHIVFKDDQIGESTAIPFSDISADTFLEQLTPNLTLSDLSRHLNIPKIKLIESIKVAVDAMSSLRS